MPASHTPGRLRPPTHPPDRAAPQCKSFRAAANQPGPTHVNVKEIKNKI